MYTTHFLSSLNLGHTISVLNHVTGAGAADGSGGSDPAGWNDKYTNFRYVSFGTPATTDTSSDYLSRAGRFPKNWQNFHNNPVIIQNQ